MAIGISRARLAIPRVNQTPRIAQNKPLRPPRVGIGPGRPATSQIGVAPAVAVSSPKPATTAPTPATLSPTGSTSEAAANSTPASTDPFAVPAYSGTADPRDATYWSNLAKLQFTDRQNYAQNLAEQSTADAAYSSAAQQAIQNRATQERQLGEQAIKGNLGASGWLNRTQGEQVRDYTQERANAALSKQQEDAARLAAREALIQGYSLDAASLLAEAGGRYSEAQQREAEKGLPEALGGTTGAGSKSADKQSKPKTANAKSNPDVHLPRRNPVKAAIANRRRAR